MTPNLLPSTRWRGLAPMLGATLVAMLAACAGVPEPREEMALGRAAMDRVSGPAGAEAPLEVASARDKITRANRALANGDHTRARQLAEQAEADAALAEAKSRAVRASIALDEVRASIRALRAELARS